MAGQGLVVVVVAVVETLGWERSWKWTGIELGWRWIQLESGIGGVGALELGHG